jgi:hypothetical protein
VELETLTPEELVIAFLLTIPPGTEFKVDSMVKFVSGRVSRRSLYRQLEDFEERGVILKVRYGIYLHCIPQQPTQ